MIIDTTFNQSISQLIFYLVIIIGTWLSLWVYCAGRDKITNRLFSLMVLIWLIGVIIPYHVFRSFVLPEEIILFLPKLELAFVFLFYIPFYFFTIYFLKEERKFPLLNKLLILVVSSGAFLSLTTNIFQKEVLIIDGKGLDLILTPAGKIIWLGFVVIMNLFILFRFLVNYFKSPKKEKPKIQYFLVGMLVWILIGFIFLIYFPLFRDTFEYAFWGLYGIIFLFFFTAYAIVKKELFDIKVILTSVFVVLIAAVLALDMIILTEEAWVQAVKGGALIIFLYFGYSLIKSVQLEIKRREELEKLTLELETINIELASAYKKLERLDKAKSEFISIASHQLRTPLTAIKGYLSMILEKSYSKPPEKMKKPLENVYASNERLIKLVNDLLSISRIEAGKIELEPEKYSIEKIISEIIQELQITAEKKNIYLKLEQPKESLPKAMIDKDKLRQVIMNAIDNAIRYTEKGGITIKYKVQEKNFKIEILDTGDGMTKEEIAKLFQTFSRGKAGAKSWTEGAGLGLFIARKFTEMHGGKIWAESKGKNKGSTFHIELPRKTK